MKTTYVHARVKLLFQRVAGMILMCWLLSGLTGFVPVFTGIYSSPEHLDLIRKNSQDCGDLVVNKYFSVFAGIVSFWTPASVMVYVYFKVRCMNTD